MQTTYQYPQYLYVYNSGGEAIQNETTGEWESSAAALWELWGVCREEANGSGQVIYASGGDAIVFSSLIQIPKGTPRINEMTEVLVSRTEITPAQLLSDNFIKQSLMSGLIVAKGRCLKYDFGRLHCRLWI
ncbi:MAG: hypothetical protein LBS01_02345 [Prevotellaceae bacterium]|jgi:hypothetical protein|nr:hypothetical protein [Prevotellaceae bacterium]